MKKNLENSLSIVLIVFAFVLMSFPALAESKPIFFMWGPGHWQDLDFKPYLENAKHPQNNQWGGEKGVNGKWSPGQWTKANGSAEKTIARFYKADIVRDQFMCNDIPVVLVGPNFYHLGGEDKRKLAMFLDTAYNITSGSENGVFYIRDWKTKAPVGAYTRYGLQIQ